MDSGWVMSGKASRRRRGNGSGPGRGTGATVCVWGEVGSGGRLGGEFSSRFRLGRASSSFQAEEGVVVVLGRK